MTIKLFMLVIAYLTVIQLVFFTLILRMIFFVRRQQDPLIAYIEKPKLEKKVNLEDAGLIG